MASIKNIVYVLWRHLEGGDITQTSKFTYKQLREYVVAGLLEAMKANYYENLNQGEYRYAGDSLKTTTTQTVKTDNESGLQYIEVPNSSIKTWGNRDLSITGVNPILSKDKYVPVTSQEVFNMKLLPTVPCIIPFYKEEGRVYFFQERVMDRKLKVHQSYSVPTDDDADLTLPEAEGYIIERALRLLSAQFPADGSNDGVDKNRIIS